MSVGPGAPPPAGAALAVSSQVQVERWTQGTLSAATDLVAEEVPVALVYHDVPHVVMLATPADLED
jgi:FdhD protein